jgi:DNA-binding response OmpR family regulator
MNEAILVVEDEEPILVGLEDLLRGEGYRVAVARDGREALASFARNRPDLVLLDVMIPEVSGYDVCREIRREDRVTPILMLTAKGQEVDKVVGLELGADDYIVKPFGVNELLARVRSALRRSRLPSATEGAGGAGNDAAGEPFAFGVVQVDPRKMVCITGGRSHRLSRLELRLLTLLYRHPGEVLDRFTILERVWGVRYEGTTRTLDQHIAGLRKKIEADPGQPRHILTVHGVGYRFEPGGEAEG